MTDPTPRRDAARSGPESAANGRNASTADEEARGTSRTLSEAPCEACRAIRPKKGPPGAVPLRMSDQ
jgi:hypothetical protein